MKGFNEALKEIRQAAGLETDVKPNISNFSQASEVNPTTSGDINGTRIRKPSSRINTEDFVTSSTPTKTRSNSKATLTESKSILSNSSAIFNEKKTKTDSLCSNAITNSPKRSKRVSYSGLDFVDYDSLVTNDVSICYFFKYLILGSIIYG